MTRTLKKLKAGDVGFVDGAGLTAVDDGAGNTVLMTPTFVDSRIAKLEALKTRQVKKLNERIDALKTLKAEIQGLPEN